MMAGPDRALVSTIRSETGGVPSLVEFVCQQLASEGIEPILCFYEPYSTSPDLSVPSFAPWHRPRARRTSAFGHQAWSLGCWFPELEFTTNWPTSDWKRVIDTCRFHLTVSGNCLPASAYALLGTRFLGWVASPWDDDRRVRATTFPWPRRLLDRAVNAPVVRRLERRILRAGTVLALSGYTRRRLEQIAGDGRAIDTLPFPIDVGALTPAPRGVLKGRIGFAGRLEEPRKNLPLLLAAAGLSAASREPRELLLIGDDTTGRLQELAAAAGVPKLTITGRLDRQDYVEALRTLDVFVLPSDQEGLCIAALEAMACGCPVISTRCGGPEDYVIDGVNGFLVDHDAGELATRLDEILGNRQLRTRLSAGARETVLSTYTLELVAPRFKRAFEHTFGGSAAVDEAARWFATS